MEQKTRLIVAAKEEDSEVLNAVLRKEKGFITSVAFSADEVLELFGRYKREGGTQLLVVDFELPGFKEMFDSLETAEGARNYSCLLVVNGEIGFQHLIKLYNRGLIQYALKKPWTPAELFEGAREALKR